jgi:FtsP/CotA-like multicopper oxidase with cupredoxin domain
MKKHLLWTSALIGATALSGPAWSRTVEYALTVERGRVNITGKPSEKITLNGGIPGPILRFTEGDEAVVRVTNRMDEDTSVHWHGILIPNFMDGVPGLGGFPGIKPGETFTYRFPLRQSGTYWYHAHSQGQEQDGHYGALVILPKGEDPVKAERDYVVLLSDYSEESSDAILSNLKMSSEYYQYARRTVFDFFDDARKEGVGKAWKNARMWGEMRMLPTDLSDVTGYAFLVNGKTPEQNQTYLFKRGERVRLRFINASAMSFYDVRIPGLKMSVVAADGQNVEPVPIDEFRFGVAETYDVVVTPPEEKAYTIAAEPIDRTGFAVATLAPREGMKGDVPRARPRALLTMADMGMDHSGMDHAAMGHAMPPASAPDKETGVPGSGWAEPSAPSGAKALAYKDLRYLGTQQDVRSPEREVEVRLGGNMERYIWTMNGKKYADAGPIRLKYGERVRLKFVNDTMMAHPMHLHGMFVQLENGQPADKLPNKHTVIVAPSDSYSVLLTADEPGEWAFHCHLLYHMMSGMMNKVVVATLDPSDVPPKKEPASDWTSVPSSPSHTHGGSHAF